MRFGFFFFLSHWRQKQTLGKAFIYIYIYMCVYIYIYIYIYSVHREEKIFFIKNQFYETWFPLLIDITSSKTLLCICFPLMKVIWLGGALSGCWNNRFVHCLLRTLTDVWPWRPWELMVMDYVSSISSCLLTIHAWCQGSSFLTA